MSRLIVFEGLDGSGKTTLSRAVAERLGATWMTTPSLDLRPMRDALLADLGDPIAAQLFYAATVRAASEKARASLRAGTPVVMDRYWLSTCIYAPLRTAWLRLDEVAATLLPADLTVFVDVPQAVRRARLAGRATTACDAETLRPEVDAALRRGYLDAAAEAICGRFVRLDGALPLEMLSERCVATVKELRH